MSRSDEKRQGKELERSGEVIIRHDEVLHSDLKKKALHIKNYGVKAAQSIGL